MRPSANYVSPLEVIATFGSVPAIHSQAMASDRKQAPSYKRDPVNRHPLMAFTRNAGALDEHFAATGGRFHE